MRPRRLNRALDVMFGAAGAAMRVGRRLDRLASRQAPRLVVVLSVYSEPRFLEELARDAAGSRHDVRFVLGALAPRPSRGLAESTALTGLAGNAKFPNLNLLLQAAEPGTVRDADWILILDDDIDISDSRPFLDRFLALLEHFSIDIGQPALTRMSETAWQVCRRRAFSLLRETHYVEPQLVAFRRHVAAELLPFPEDFGGYGNDLHWVGVAVQRGWRVGVADAVPVRHEARPYGAQYSHEEAAKLRQHFLAQRPHLTPHEADRTVAKHRTLRVASPPHVTRKS
jgi:hypothetical protein